MSGQPYFEHAGELVADCVALLTKIWRQRPETLTLGNALVVSFDSTEEVITVGLKLPDGRVAIVERILVSPGDPARFGSSDLKVRIVPSGESTH